MGIRYKANDLIAIHNNIAKRKGLPQIMPNAKITVNEICDKIEWVNSLKGISKDRKRFISHKTSIGKTILKFLFSRRGK